MQFRGKVDLWAALAIFGSPAITLAVAIHLGSTVFFLVFAAQAAFILGCCFPQWYRLEENESGCVLIAVDDRNAFISALNPN